MKVWPILAVFAACLIITAAVQVYHSDALNPAPLPTPASTQVPIEKVPTLVSGPSGPPPDPNTIATPPAGACHLDLGLPDHTCTPGLLNPSVTVFVAPKPSIFIDVDSKTLDFCSRQFSTSMIRPPESYTNVLKKRLMVSYGIKVENVTINGVSYSTESFYELDHDVSLEDMGHPWAVGNLFPEPRKMTFASAGHPAVPTGLPGPWAEDKDVKETSTHNRECSDPAHAQDYSAQLAYDWTKLP